MKLTIYLMTIYYGVELVISRMIPRLTLMHAFGNQHIF